MRGLSVRLSQFPLILGQVARTLMIQINGDAFDVYSWRISIVLDRNFDSNCPPAIARFSTVSKVW